MSEKKPQPKQISDNPQGTVRNNYDDEPNQKNEPPKEKQIIDILDKPYLKDWQL